uniref:Uncharacterized protein n=1 Tax=Oryza brachyantha TaxID=4533 RepID=J3LSN0_ORYBR
MDGSRQSKDLKYFQFSCTMPSTIQQYILESRHHYFGIWTGFSNGMSRIPELRICTSHGQLCHWRALPVE